MKVSIVKKNKFLPLLTDTLPYEVPISFSNRGFYKTIKNLYDNYYNEQVKKIAKGEKTKIENKSIFDFIIKKGIGNKYLNVKLNLLQNYTIPYTYQINKNEHEKREISLIHPFAQLKICDFYFKYETVILYNTCKSDISLRHPVKISSKTLKELDLLTIKLMEEDASDIDINEVINYAKILNIENIPNTYFTYSKYPILYKFYESEEFLGLEQKYKYCLKFDIQKCFDSIYTHSICWAIKNKYYAKKNKNKDSFENKIDELMRYSNWEETNGIPIGSEFSRIFAEILLQKIDQEVEKKLKEYLKGTEKHLSNKQNFCIKRYVDDYFVFVNDEKFGEEVIVNLYEQKLKEYKLFINKSKNKKIERPFVTNISAAKYKSMPLLRNYLDDNLIDNEQKQIKSSKNLINQIRTIVYDNKVNMVDISNIILSTIFKELLNILKDNELKQKNLDKIKKYLLEIINLSFYIFNLSLKSNSTNGICKICIVIWEILKKIDNKENIVDIIKEKISFMLIQFFETKVETDFQLLEYLDLIWILDIYEYKIPVERLSRILEKANTYFEFMVLLSYIKNKEEYNSLKEILFEKIISNFEKNKDCIFNNTETFLLFFDTLKCPWLTDEKKKIILDVVGYKRDKIKIIKFVETKDWFFIWDNDKIKLVTLFEIKKSRIYR